MSYGGDTWYMGRISEELKNYACVWLIFMCMINLKIIQKLHGIDRKHIKVCK